MYQRKTFIQAMRTFYKFAKMIHQLNQKNKTNSHKISQKSVGLQVSL